MFANRKSISNFKLLTDLILIGVIFFISAFLAQPVDVLFERQYMFILPLLELVIWMSSSRFTKLYFNSIEQSSFSYSFKLIKNIFVQLISAVFFLFIIKENLFTRNFILYYTFLLFSLSLGKEFLFDSIINRSFTKGKNLKRLAIVGGADAGKHFAELLENNKKLGCDVIGFINDVKSENKYLGTENELRQIIRQNRIDEIIIALPAERTDSIDKILKTCDICAVKAFVVPDYLKFLSNRFQIEMVDDYPLISVRSNPLEEIQWRIIKRLFDIVFSLLVLIFVFSWLLPVIALAIKLSSKGNIFFIQDRVGRNNKIFKCFKFRTMTQMVSARSGSTRPVTDEDERVTSIGKFLRKSNLDEFPQFINVLKGDMSIVGPRPHAVPFEIYYGEIVEEIRLRHRIKPGITGWAQIHGYRGDVFDFEVQKLQTQKRIEFDIWYIENWSFGLDFRIIIKTFLQTINPGFSKN